MHRIIGIDLGKTSIHVAFPPPERRSAPRLWKSVVEIAFTTPNWWQTLLNMIDDDAIIAAEPTGSHILAPIARLIERERRYALVWQVDHKVTAMIRNSAVSAVKSDRYDAIALYLIAESIAAGTPPIGTRLFSPQHADALSALRALMNQHRSLKKETTRTINRLRALAFQINPIFATSDTYISAALQGVITLYDMHEALFSQEGKYARGNRHHHHLKKLLDKAAPIPTPTGIPEIIRAIANTLAHYRRQIDSVESDINILMNDMPFVVTTRRWRTMPGYSPLFAAPLLIASNAAIESMTRDQFVACIAANPRIMQSGAQEKAHANKRGYAPARAALHLWTLQLLRKSAPENSIRAKYHAVKERNGKAYAAAKTKLARVLWGIANDSTLDASGVGHGIIADPAVDASNDMHDIIDDNFDDLLETL